MTQDEFEASIGGDFEEVRNELRVEQVTPAHDVQREAIVRVRPRLEPRMRQVHASLSERVQGFLGLRQGAELWRESHALEPDALYVDIIHHSDRTYAGYGNIYRAIKLLAPCLEDARFFITEQYDTFVDEYRIEGGALRFFRGDCGEDSSDAIMAWWMGRVEASPKDHDLRRFVARQQVYDGEFHARKVGSAPPGKAEREDDAREAMTAFELATKLDPDCARAWKQMAALHLLLGNRSQAAKCFERALSLRADSETLQAQALVAFSAGRDADAIAGLRRIPTEERTRLSYQLEGYLLARAGEAGASAEAFAMALRGSPNKARDARLNPDAEALFRTGRADELLAAWFDHVTARLGSDPEPAARALVIRDLIEWGEFFRIKMHHEFSPPRSRELALGFYDRAIALGDPGGAAHYSKGLLLQHTGSSAEAVLWFTGALEKNPGHLEALGKLGTAALASQDREAAITHLRNYVERSRDGSGGSYYRQNYASQLVKALYEKANHLNDVVRDPAAAEAVFDEIISLGPYLPTALRDFEGAWVGKSNARAWRRDHEAALEFAERALELKPNSGYALSAKGSALNNLRRYDEAMPCYDRAIAAEPGYWHPYYCKACTMALTGQDRRKIYALIQKARSLAPPQRQGTFRDEPDFASLRNDPAFMALFDSNAPAPPETSVGGRVKKPTGGKSKRKRKR